jgi:hypothetical protein
MTEPVVCSVVKDWKHLRSLVVLRHITKRFLLDEIYREIVAGNRVSKAIETAYKTKVRYSDDQPTQ